MVQKGIHVQKFIIHEKKRKHESASFYVLF